MGTDFFDGTEVALAIFSCIYKTRQKFGKNHIASVLIGSQSQKVVKYNHQDLESYGVLKQYSFEQVKVFLQELIEQGLLEQTKTEYPTLKLLDKSTAVQAGKAKVSLKQPDPELARKVGMEKGESIAKTLELFNQGKNVSEIALLRNISVETVHTHLAEAYQQGEKLNINQFVPEAKQERISEEFKKLGTDFLTPVKKSLGESFTWEELKWVRAKLLRNGSSPTSSMVF